MIRNNFSDLFNKHSKLSISVVSADVNVIPRYSKPLKDVQITNLDDLHVGEKSIGTVMNHKTSHPFLSSVI